MLRKLKDRKKKNRDKIGNRIARKFNEFDATLLLCVIVIVLFINVVHCTVCPVRPLCHNNKSPARWYLIFRFTIDNIRCVSIYLVR